MLGLYSSQLRTHTSYHWLRWPDVLELTSHTACIKDSCSVSSSSVMSYVLVGSSRLWRRTLDTYQVFWMICCPRWQQWKVAVHIMHECIVRQLSCSSVSVLCHVMWRRSYLAVHSFGRRMLYPGTTALIQALMGQFCSLVTAAAAFCTYLEGRYHFHQNMYNGAFIYYFLSFSFGVAPWHTFLLHASAEAGLTGWPNAQPQEVTSVVLRDTIRLTWWCV